MSTKEKILESAKELFSKKGYDGTSIRDICDQAEVAVSAINYHFNNKQALYQALFDGFGRDHLAMACSILSEPKDKNEFRLRLEMFMDSAVLSLLKDPQLFKLINREIENLQSDLDQSFKEIFIKMFEEIVGYIEKAKKNKIVSKKIDSEAAATLISNQISNSVKSDELNQKFYSRTLADQKYRKQWIKNNLDIITTGILSEGV